MIAAENEEVLWVLDLVCEQQADSFQRLFSSVYIVAEEEVVGLGREATVFEKSEKIVVLTVDVTTNLFSFTVSYLWRN